MNSTQQRYSDHCVYLKDGQATPCMEPVALSPQNSLPAAPAELTPKFGKRLDSNTASLKRRRGFPQTALSKSVLNFT